ncbi:hypothetical protein [Agrobacterium sp. NPDC090273]|uniref:hypothetical protein n=1 Tax=Agrobacterium sp. NPDC090273 TaxID=3363919 RepID=UPI00383AA5B6
MLAYLFATHPDPEYSLDAYDVLFYAFLVLMSLFGTIPGCFLVGIPSVIVTNYLAPGAPFRASTLLVCGAVFTWVFVLGWPATMLFEISYADILLLSPYAFCSAVALAYLVNRKMEA